MSFDELVQLSPQELEELRQKEVSALIDQAPAHLQPRLRGLQFEVDAKRRAAATPMAACVSISQMMQESLTRLQAALNGEPLPRQEEVAEVIPIRSRRRSPHRPMG